MNGVLIKIVIWVYNIKQISHRRDLHFWRIGTRSTIICLTTFCWLIVLKKERMGTVSMTYYANRQHHLFPATGPERRKPLPKYRLHDREICDKIYYETDRKSPYIYKNKCENDVKIYLSMTISAERLKTLGLYPLLRNLLIILIILSLKNCWFLIFRRL